MEPPRRHSPKAASHTEPGPTTERLKVEMLYRSENICTYIYIYVCAQKVYVYILTAYNTGMYVIVCIYIYIIYPRYNTHMQVGRQVGMYVCMKNTYIHIETDRESLQGASLFGSRVSVRTGRGRCVLLRPPVRALDLAGDLRPASHPADGAPEPAAAAWSPKVDIEPNLVKLRNVCTHK